MRNVTKTFYSYLKEAVTPPGQVKGLVFYKGAQTQAGGTTPTGENNAITDNMFGLTEDKVYKMAYDFKFRTDNNRNFQTDLYTYLSKNKPEIIKAMWTKYGTTAQGQRIAPTEQNINSYVDGILGARTMYIIANTGLEPTPPPPVPTKAFTGSGYFGPNNALLGLGRYQTRDSKSITDNGQKADPNIEFMFVIPNTAQPDASKGLYVIPSSVWSNQICRGTNKIETPKLIDQYKVATPNPAQSADTMAKTNNVPDSQLKPTTVPPAQ